MLEAAKVNEKKSQIPIATNAEQNCWGMITIVIDTKWEEKGERKMAGVAM